MSIDPRKVRSAVVEVECQNCRGKGRVPGGQRQYGEMVVCPLCHAKGVTREAIPLPLLYDLLFGNLRASAGAAAAPGEKAK